MSSGKTIQLRVVTAEGQAIADEVVSIRAPGALGYLGILHNHAPLVTTIRAGQLTWRRPTGEIRVARIGDGLLEVARNQCTVLTTAVSEAASASASPGGFP